MCGRAYTWQKRLDKQILFKSSWSHFKTSCWSKHFRTVFTSFVVTYMYHMSNCGLYAINDWVCRLIIYNYVFDLQRSNLSNLTCYIPLWLSHHLHWCNIWSLYLNLFVIFSHVLWFFSNILKWNHMSDDWFLIKGARYVFLFIGSMDTLVLRMLILYYVFTPKTEKPHQQCSIIHFASTNECQKCYPHVRWRRVCTNKS